MSGKPEITERLWSGFLIAAGLIMVSGATIGFVAPSLREAPWTDDIQEAARTIAGNPSAYAWANGLFLVAALLTALALVPISDQFIGKSRLWALTALAAYAFGAVFEFVDRTISMQVYTWAAQQDFLVSDATVQAFIRFQGGLGYGFFILGFLAISLYGIAILFRSQKNRVGWLFLIGGILGIVLQVVGAAIPAFVFVGTVALGVEFWLHGANPDSAA